MCRADTTLTPSGISSRACCAAEPCQTPSMRVALPLTAAASGTVASISSFPGERASLMLASVSAWLRKGTLRMTVSAARTASAFSCAAKEPPGYLESLKRRTPEIAFDPAKLKTEEEKEALLRERLDVVKDQRLQDWGLGIIGTIALLYFLGWLGPIFGFLAALVYLAGQALHLWT